MATIGAQAASVSLTDSVRPVDNEAAAPDSRHARIARRDLDAAEASAEIDFELPLKLRRFDELSARVARGEIISEAEMTARYRPSAADSATVLAWVQAQGLQVDAASDAGTIFGHASVARLAQAFQTTFARVSWEGSEYTSAIAAPSLPSEVADVVLGVNGLQPHLRLHRHLQRAAISPLSLNSFGAPYTPKQILAAYGGGSLTNTGSGQTIAIVGETTPANSDLTAFWSAVGSPQTLSNITTVQVVTGSLPSPATDAGTEATLDVEWSSALAPAAAIRVYATVDGSTVHFDKAYAQILKDLQSISGLRQLSISYGSPEVSDDSLSQVRTDDQYFAELAAAGVTVFASSGDGGSNPDQNGDYSSTAPAQVEFPASDANVTAVGGTSLSLNASIGSIQSETVWSDSGGGASVYVSRPSWQTGAGVPGGSMRLVPDVAAAADPNNGAYLYWNGSPVVVGGTSWSAPVWASFCALINQTRAAAGSAAVGPLGAKLYALIGTASFRDVSSGSNGLYTAAAGYDECTGLGSPNLAYLLPALAGTTTAAGGASGSSGTTGSSGASSGSTVVMAPAITTSPASLTVAWGASASFAVTATGTGPLSYQWNRNGSAISGATAASYSIAAAAAGSAGTYGVTVTNSAGSATSSSATLAVNLDPVVVTPPASTVLVDGASGSLSVSATGPALTYQWQFNGVNIAGATSSTLSFSQVSATQSGVYSVVITNSAASITQSTTVTVQVNARLVNISSRAAVDPDHPLVAGFIVQGAGNKQVLLRGIGPGLTEFGISNVLATPAIALYASTGAQLASNGSWGGGSSLSALFTQVGAFPLTAGSADAALSTALAAGTYSDEISGAGGSGIALAEIYDADAPTSASRLINLSSRAGVGSGLNALVTGFVVSGTSSETVLLRGIGPALASFGISDAVAAPVLTVYNSSGSVLATNQGWSSSLASSGWNLSLAAIFAEVGAFSLPAGSADCALVLNLEPGSYTAQLTSASGATGTGMVEIYDVP